MLCNRHIIRPLNRAARETVPFRLKALAFLLSERDDQIEYIETNTEATQNVCTLFYRIEKLPQMIPARPSALNFPVAGADRLDKRKHFSELFFFKHLQGEFFALFVRLGQIFCPREQNTAEQFAFVVVQILRIKR